MKQLLKFSLFLVVLLAGLTTRGQQLNYGKFKLNGEPFYRPEAVEGSQNYYGTAPVTKLPSGARSTNGAANIRRPWLPSPGKRNFQLVDMGGSKSKYFLSIDFRPDYISHQQWLNAGVTRLSQFTSDQTGGLYPFSGVPDSQKFLYLTESGLNRDKEGYLYWRSTLAEMEQLWMNTIPGHGRGVLVFPNQETSNFWSRWYHGNQNGEGNIGHFPPWPQIKDDVIVLESQPGSMTVEQLFNSGLYNQEIAVRRQNRLHIQHAIIQRNGAASGIGSSAYQGDPGPNTLTNATRFLDEGSANVNNIGGSNGVITLNGRTYTGIEGSFWKRETVNLNYYYYFDCRINGKVLEDPDYENPNHPYANISSAVELYKLIQDPNPVAREVGHWLGNDRLLKQVHGGKSIPTVRMTELHYEGGARWPKPFRAIYPWGDPAKIWLPPVTMRTIYMVNHFLEGETENAGFHIFYAAGSPNQGIIYNLDSRPNLNHEFHTLDALFAARRDMEPMIDKISGSTLITDLDIRVGNTGDFQRLNGVDSWNQNKPCFVARPKVSPTGTSVLLMGGYGQSFNTTRTDQVRIPGYGNGSVIEITYKGPDVQFFEVFFPADGGTMQYVAKSIVPAWEKQGYGGWILHNN